MWIDNKIFREDLDKLIACEYIPWVKLQNKTVLVTGATGVIGYNLVSGLVYANIKKSLNMHIFALVRDIEKAKEKYAEQLRSSNSISFISGEVEHLPSMQEKIDYIIHGASPTASVFFIENPVETIKTSVVGTMNMLELAEHSKVQGLVYLSSMEVYGAPKTEDILYEEDLGYLDHLNIRNCYPEAKRQCEALCAAYVSEYSVPAMSVRLAQTFGPGVNKDDSRVFAEFARCAMDGKDIILLTDGGSKRCYLYTMDAVSAILTVLLKGEAGQAYNAANSETYCSVKEMAAMVAKTIGEDKIKVRVSKDKEKSKKFSSPHFYNLSVARIMELGWRPSRNLLEMYQRMIEINGDEKIENEMFGFIKWQMGY